MGHREACINYRSSEKTSIQNEIGKELEIKITPQNLHTQKFKIKRLLFRLAKRLEQMRRRLTGEFQVEQCIDKMKERNPDWKDAF